MSIVSECTSGGCGAKIGPEELRGLIADLDVKDPRLLVGFSASDDAAVYRLGPDQAVVSTVDFFSPMVENPFLFGEIAAANALSDVYAMGAIPAFALNLVCFPEKMDKTILTEILQGGLEKVREAGAVIAGGHSIYDREPKYGLAVTGFAHPDQIYRNNTVVEGDALILTKPLGVGILMAALRGEAATEDQARPALDSMRRLNRYAAEKLSGYTVHACTDVTGFGLAGHSAEMAGGDHTLVMDTDSIPALPGALEFAGEYLVTTAGQRNRNHLAEKIDWAGVAPAMQELVLDPQTSGGLLVSLPADQAQQALAEIQRDDPWAAMIGVVDKKRDSSVEFL